MEKIELLTSECGDWQVLRIDGEVYDEGHRIDSETWLGLLEKFGVTVSEEWISDEDMEYGRY